MALRAHRAECNSASVAVTTAVRSTAALRVDVSLGEQSSNAHVRFIARASRVASITAITRPRTVLAGWRA